MAAFVSGPVHAQTPSQYCTQDQGICFEAAPDVLKLPNLDGERVRYRGQTWSSSWGDANGNIWPDLYLNHHTWENTHGRYPSSHLIYDPGLNPKNWTFTELVQYGDQHSATFIDLNSDGHDDILEMVGGRLGTATAESKNTSNGVFLSAKQSPRGSNPAPAMKLDFTGARGRYALPINHNGTLKLLMLNLSRDDGKFGSALMAYDGGVAFQQEDIFFQAQCLEASCLRSTFNIGACQGALSLHMNADTVIDLLCFNFDDTESIKVLLADPKSNSFVNLGGNKAPGRVRDANIMDVKNDGAAQVLMILEKQVGLGKPAPDELGGVAFNFKPFDTKLRGKPIALVSGDWDNDKDIDFITYHLVKDSSFRFAIWVNDGTGKFTAESFRDAKNKGVARNVSVADYNLDGALDVLFSDGKFAEEETVKSGGYVLLEGKASQNWLQVDLVDDLNLKGLGSRVTVTADGTQITRWQHSGVHGEVQDHIRLHFGLGDAETVDLSVTWWDGTQTDMSGVKVNRLLAVSKP
ncbi:CRTAC1 family protein [Alphaproteobacteria bacterium]|nr:CRTAC1 family protein [Alphaproteobacteria bacterium]